MRFVGNDMPSFACNCCAWLGTTKDEECRAGWHKRSTLQRPSYAPGSLQASAPVNRRVPTCPFLEGQVGRALSTTTVFYKMALLADNSGNTKPLEGQ